MEKRRQVDIGSATVAELQIAYLQATPTPEQKQREEQPLVQFAGMMKSANTDAESSDSQAATLITFVTLGGLMIVILLSASISWRVAKSIIWPAFAVDQCGRIYLATPATWNRKWKSREKTKLPNWPAPSTTWCSTCVRWPEFLKRLQAAISQ